MKLKRICKVEYKDDVAVIPRSEKVKYDVYFIDNEDWLCIDEDDYTPGKHQSRAFEDMHRFFKRYKDNGSGVTLTGYVYTPYIPLHIVDEMVTIKI